MKIQLFYFTVILTILFSSCSRPEDRVFNSFGEAYDNPELVYTIIENSQNSNDVTEIPTFVCEFTNLKSLTVSYKKLTFIPDCMSNMKTIKELILDYNELEYIPINIGEMTSLDRFDLTGNNIKSIPESIGNLKKLRELYLRGNNLTTLPQSMEKLEKLRILDLGYNKFSKKERFRITKMLPKCEIWWD